jgi:redox-sensitive bicupin YhaK (pirin superfamily)
MNSTIEHIIVPNESDLGDNFVVRRSLPKAKKRLVGPFIFWDHMGPVVLQGDNSMKVRAHPHIGLATITYLFSGSILHRDSLGNEQYIRPGEVNWMTAGKGIAHSERANFEEPTTLEGIQLWVALPREHEEVDPSFVHHKEKDLPLLESGPASLRLIAGSALGHQSPVPVYSDLFYFAGEFKKSGSLTFNLGENQEAGLYVIEGTIDCEGQTFERYNLITFKKGSELSFSASEGARFMLFGGDVFPEGRTIWWNFVSSNPERIEKAKDDWSSDRFGKVINETEFIPLPEN